MVTNKENYIDYILKNLSLDINLNYFCSLGCLGCNRLLGFKQYFDKNVSLEQIDCVLKESIALDIHWKHIRLSGGEPTLHQDILKIVQHLCHYKDKHNTELQIVTNGFSHITKNIIKKLSKYPIEIRNSNKNKTAGDTEDFYSHCVCPSDVNMKSNIQLLKCEKPHECGILLDVSGYYICHMAATIEMYFNLLRAGKTLSSMLTRKEILNQINSYCQYCGNVCNPKFKKEFMSNKWICQLIKKKIL